MEQKDWIDKIEDWKLVRFLKAMAPIGLALGLLGVGFGAYNVWLSTRLAAEARLDRAVEIFLAAEPADRRLANALNDLSHEGYQLSPLIMPALSGDPPFYMATIDFSWKYYSSSDLSGNNLAFARFVGTDLFRSRFVGADLTWADFRYARLHDADLEDAKLACADLRFANLQGANFSGVDFGHPMGCQTQFEADELPAAFYFSDNPPTGLSEEHLAALQVCNPDERLADVGDTTNFVFNRSPTCATRVLRDSSSPPRRIDILLRWFSPAR